MPQCVSGNWRHSDTLVGPGSLYTHMLQTGYRTRNRAAKANEGEKCRLHLHAKMMDKHQRAQESTRTRIMGGVRKTVEQLDAYQRVLAKDYKVENFKTMQLGFKASRDIRTPASFRRYKMETRIYNCGFNKETLQSEVKRVMGDQKPDQKRKAFRSQLLEVARGRSNFMIDRKITDRAMREEQYGLIKAETFPTVSEKPELGPRSNTFLTTDGMEEDT